MGLTVCLSVCLSDTDMRALGHLRSLPGMSTKTPTIYFDIYSINKEFDTVCSVVKSLFLQWSPQYIDDMKRFIEKLAAWSALHYLLICFFGVSKMQRVWTMHLCWVFQSENAQGSWLKPILTSCEELWVSWQGMSFKLNGWIARRQTDR